MERVRQLFTEAQVFDKADALIEKFRARAETVAAGSSVSACPAWPNRTPEPVAR